MSRLLIFGAGKIADQAYAYFSADASREIVAFVVDRDYFRDGAEKFGRPICAMDEVARRFPPEAHAMFVAVGYLDMNSFRRERYEDARGLGYELVSYVSSRAAISDPAAIGPNSWVLEFSSVQPMASVGSNVLIFPGVVVGHHASVGDHCYVSSGAVIGGNTTVGESCFVGLNATIGHEVSIGAGSFIGAGAKVTKDIPPGSVHIVPDTPRYRLDAESFSRLTKMK